MAVKLEQKSVLLAETEVTYGTDATPTTTDAIIVQNAKIRPTPNKHEPKFAGNHISTFRPYIGKKKISLDFTTFFYTGMDAGDVSPRISRLFKALGIREVQTVGTKYDYSPAIVYPHDSVTLWLYKDGLLYKMRGARGRARIYFESGVCKIDWHFEGLQTNPAGGAIITPNLTSDPGWNQPPLVLGATASWGALSGANLMVKSFELNLNNKFAEVDSVVDATGLAEVAIVSREVTGKMVVATTLEATEPWWADFFDQIANALSIQWGSAANRIKIASTGGTGAYITAMEPVDLDGVMGYSVDFILNPTAGDDEFTITLD